MLWLALFILAAWPASAAQGQCTAAPDDKVAGSRFDYSEVFSKQRDETIQYADLPGFTRSVYASDHALVTPESRVWAPSPFWRNTQTAHIISPAKGAHFSMYLVNMGKDSSSLGQSALVERFAFVVEGSATAHHENSTSSVDAVLGANDWVLMPPAWDGTLTSATGAKLLVFERMFAKAEGMPWFCYGHTDDSPVLPVEPEVFVLRKLLPATSDFDFNVHVMDFEPGQYLYIKEVHYNQHGLLLLQGQGIYRLGNNWYPVQAGDAIWMPPYVPQWYAALGTKPSRYILYKDTNLDPLFSP